VLSAHSERRPGALEGELHPDVAQADEEQYQRPRGDGASGPLRFGIAVSYRLRYGSAVSTLDHLDVLRVQLFIGHVTALPDVWSF
jgi:hypothetical protein